MNNLPTTDAPLLPGGAPAVRAPMMRRGLILCAVCILLLSNEAFSQGRLTDWLKKLPLPGVSEADAQRGVKEALAQALRIVTIASDSVKIMSNRLTSVQGDVRGGSRGVGDLDPAMDHGPGREVVNDVEASARIVACIGRSVEEAQPVRGDDQPDGHPALRQHLSEAEKLVRRG